MAGIKIVKIKFMENNEINIAYDQKVHKTGIVLGIIYGLVAAGFYTTPLMVFLLGMASLSTAVALQRVLIKNFGWLFLCLGILLGIVTIMIYLRRKNVEKLTLSEIKPYRAFIGALTISLIVSYAIIITLVLFNFIE